MHNKTRSSNGRLQGIFSVESVPVTMSNATLHLWDFNWAPPDKRTQGGGVGNPVDYEVRR